MNSDDQMFMLLLPNTLRAFGASGFETALKQELAQHAGELPLQQGLLHGNRVTDAPVTVMLHNVTATDDTIRVKAGIFYRGVLSGCSCADDPTPGSESNEYCEVLLLIDKTTAATTVSLTS